MLPAIIRTRFTPLACARGLGVALAFVVVASPALAAPPVDPGERKAIVAGPTALEVSPVNVALNGEHDARQLVVSAKYADGTIRDLTGVVEAKVEPAGVVDVQ